MLNLDAMHLEYVSPSPEPTVFVVRNDFESKILPLVQANEPIDSDADSFASISQLRHEMDDLKQTLLFQEYRLKTALVHVCTCTSLVFSLIFVGLCMYSCQKKKYTHQIVKVEPLKTETLKV